MIQGIGHEEADGLVRAMFQERAAAIRTSGVGKMLMGGLLMAVPVVAYIIFALIGVISIKLFAITVIIGLWGAWMELKGIIMFLSPKSEQGDVSDL
jgi:hypothetical protein